MGPQDRGPPLVGKIPPNTRNIVEQKLTLDAQTISLEMVMIQPLINMMDEKNTISWKKMSI
jgi:hypothetical protein